MRLTALVESVDHVCCRYRLAAFRFHLEKAGHQLELRPFPRSWWTWLNIKHVIGGTDAVIVQRRLLAAWQLALLRRAAPLLFFDFDDAVFLRDSYSAKGLRSRRRMSRFAKIVGQADAVVAGNSFLQEEAAQWNSRRRIHVIPTCVDPRRYSVAQHRRTEAGVELVWIGSSTTMQGLEAIRPLLEDIGRSWQGLRLKLICDRFLQLKDLSVVSCRWSEATEASELAAADIGISWIPNDTWSRGKCGLKVLQYMAAGLPVVANAVGVQAEIVRHGETGFLVDSAAEWSAAVGKLAHDPSLRQRMGAAGRRRVEKEFSVPVGAARWIQFLNTMQTERALAG